MQYLIEMKLVESSRPATPSDGLSLIDQYILPSLNLCRKYVEEKKIVAGGPMSAAIGLALIVDANSALELDQIVTSLPVWPRMHTTVTPLTTFTARAELLEGQRSRLTTLMSKPQQVGPAAVVR